MKNKMIDLHNALFAELEALQDEDSFKDENGNIDNAKVDIAIKRADAVNSIAGRITELTRLQLDAVRVADNMGMSIQLPETLGAKEIDWRKK